MTTTTKTNEDLVVQFAAFKESIIRSMGVAEQQLRDGDYEGCQTTLARIALAHARSSMTLRSVCIRRKLMKGDE
jgi:hypothetical protein